jgi:glycerophosphoryl diester phosphodiesterase
VTGSQVKISAHAGAKSSTMETCRQAVAAKADYVELDIRRTADKELVAFHDPCTSQGRPLSEVGYAQLCDLAGYEVPKVTDLLAAIAGHAKGHLDRNAVLAFPPENRHPHHRPARPRRRDTRPNAPEINASQ